MKCNYIISAILGILISASSYAQTIITSQYNGYRDGDKLYRVVADYAYIGNRGENCVWELPSALKDDKIFTQTVSLRNDSLTITEGDLMLHYIANDKELSMRGFQNRGMYGIQANHTTELRYPFAYGDSIAGNYSRKTTYFDTFTIEGDGTSYTICDGVGILTDGIEKLENVLRVHHHNTIVSKYDNIDGETIEAETTEDKYLWYYPGCRYPIMDTRVVSSKNNGKIMNDTIFTSLYLPELQLEDLEYDDDNMQLLAQYGKKTLGGSDVNPDEGIPFPIKMSAYLQNNAMEMVLDYQTVGDTKASFYAYDLSGRLLGSMINISKEKGSHHDVMVLCNRPVNNIVMLTMIADGIQQVFKIR